MFKGFLALVVFIGFLVGVWSMGPWDYCEIEGGPWSLCKQAKYTNMEAVKGF